MRVSNLSTLNEFGKATPADEIGANAGDFVHLGNLIMETQMTRHSVRDASAGVPMCGVRELQKPGAADTLILKTKKVLLNPRIFDGY